MKKKILFVCKKRNNSYDPTGISYGLLNSCRFVGEAMESEFPDVFTYDIVVVTDNNDIEREVVRHKPTHVIIEALWVVPSKFEILLPKYKHISWTVRLHSKAPFIANEGIAFEWMHAYARLSLDHKNFGMSVNDKSFSKDMTDLFDQNVAWLPNVYNPAPCGHPRKELTDKNIIDIGCFGAIRPLKNHLELAIAAITYADACDLTLRFHINSERVEQKGEPILKNIRSLFAGTKHELVEHPWYNHHDFLKVVRTMDLGMQISFSETFNSVAADFVNNDVPVIVSDEIGWASRLYQVSPTDTKKIIRKIKFAHNFNGLGVHYLNKMGLNSYNKKAIEGWLEYLFHNCNK